MEFFPTQHTRELLRNKNVVIIGDSVQRSVYKDLVLLIHQDRFLQDKELRAKGEQTFQGDSLLEGGVKDGLNNGVNYVEARRFIFPDIQLRFYFVTRCYSEYLAGVLAELQDCPPDVIIMNSCLWDLHRYGEHGPAAFRKNLRNLLEDVHRKLPNSAFMWVATLPVDRGCKAGFLDMGEYRVQVQYNEITEANFVACQTMEEYGRIFVNLNRFFVHQLHNRARDGVHWNNIAHRQITNMLLTEMSKLWDRRVGIPLPRGPALPASAHQHRRTASLPELDFRNDPPCRPVMPHQGRPMPLMSNFVNHHEAPYRAPIPPHPVGDEHFEPNNNQGWRVQPRFGVPKGIHIFSKFTSYLGWSRKRPLPYDEQDNWPLPLRPPKRPCNQYFPRMPECANPGQVHGFRPTVVPPHWGPRPVDERNWRPPNAMNGPQGPQWRPPVNHIRPGRKLSLTQKVRFWWRKKVHKPQK